MNLTGGFKPKTDPQRRGNGQARPGEAALASPRNRTLFPPPAGNEKSGAGKNRRRSRNGPERRRYRRFSTQGDAFAMLKPHSQIMGQIIDISRGGLSFLYLPTTAPAPLVDRVCELHILLADHSFYFDTFPCRIVSDTEISSYEFGFTLLAMRRQSVAFLELTDPQLAQLEYFTRNHTTDAETSHLDSRNG